MGDIGGLIAAIFWNLLTWWLGLPSSSHTLMEDLQARQWHMQDLMVNMKEVLPVIAFIF